MNYYERHLGDYAKDTAHLSMLEHGAYSLLLDRYYGTEMGIPISQAHRLARARSKEEKQAVDDVLAEFFQLVDGVWINQRAEEEIAKAQVKINAAKENGKKGGRPPRVKSGSETETQEKPGGLFVGSETETQEKAHQSPVTSLHVNPSTQPSSPTEPVVALEKFGSDDFRAIPDVPVQPGQWLIWFNQTQGTEYDPGSRFTRGNVWQTFTRWCGEGVSTADVSAGIARALAEAKGQISNLPGYVEKLLLNDQQARASPQRISHSDASKLAAARAIFGTEIEGNQHGQSQRIIDVTPAVAEIGSGKNLSGDARQLRQSIP